MQVAVSRRTLLVDECVPRRFVRALHDLAPRSVQQLGWSGTKNGKLLARAAGQFEVIFTVDRDFAGLSETVPHSVAVVILEAKSTDYEVLLTHVDAVKEAIGRVAIGRVLRIGGKRGSCT